MDLGNSGNNLFFLWVMDKVPKGILLIYIIAVIKVEIIHVLSKIRIPDTLLYREINT